MKQKVVKFNVPSMTCLIKAIKTFEKSTNFGLSSNNLKTFMLDHEDFFIQITILKSNVNIKFIAIPYLQQ